MGHDLPPNPAPRIELQGDVGFVDGAGSDLGPLLAAVDDAASALVVPGVLTVASDHAGAGRALEEHCGFCEALTLVAMVPGDRGQSWVIEVDLRP